MFTLQGGPAVLSVADQLSGDLGQPEAILDIDPYTDKSCARHNSGSYCKANTTDGVELFKSVQLAVNSAAAALKAVGAIELFTPLKIDGVIGPKTADLAFEVLMAASATARTKVWLADPRSVKTELLAPLLASQPQYAVETFEEIATVAGQAPQPVPAPAVPAVPTVPAVPAPTTPAVPTVPVPSVPTPPAVPAKRFWTRKKKIAAVAGVGVLAVGLLALVLWLRKRHD